MNKGREIDVIGIVLQVFKEWRFVGKCALATAIIGVVFALCQTKEYSASVLLAPESSSGENMLGGMSELASSFGVNLGNIGGEDAISPRIYPDIFASNEFIIPLLDVKVREKDNPVEITYKEHLLGDSTSFSLKSLFKSLFSKNAQTNSKKSFDLFELSKEEEELLRMMKSCISCMSDKKTEIITISVKDEDPVVAAIIADTVQRRLQEYITEYRTKKVKNDLDYFNKLYTEAKDDYSDIRKRYIKYSDSHKGLILESYKAEQEDLENEMQLKYNILTQVTVQVQRAKAKVQEATPAFTIIQGATIPNSSISIPRSYIVIIFFILGLIGGSAWILGQKYITIIVNRLKKESQNSCDQ